MGFAQLFEICSRWGFEVGNVQDHDEVLEFLELLPLADADPSRVVILCLHKSWKTKFANLVGSDLIKQFSCLELFVFLCYVFHFHQSFSEVAEFLPLFRGKRGGGVGGRHSCNSTTLGQIC